MTLVKLKRIASQPKSQIGLLPPPTCAKLLGGINVTPPPAIAAPGLATLLLTLLLKVLGTDQQLLEKFPKSASLVALRRLGLRYIILESAYYDGQEHLSLQSVESALATVPRLNKVAVIDNFIIYEFIR